MVGTLKIAVCLKQVPLLDRDLTILGDRLVEEGLRFHLNEFDDYALEEALQLKERNGAEVSVITLGPERCREVLFTAMAKGADNAVHILDDVERDCSPFMTAEMLAFVIRKMQPSMIFTGVQSVDTAHSQVGVLLAGYLDHPHVSSVTDVRLEGSAAKAIATREEGLGRTAMVEVALPCVFTVQTGWKQPRYAPVLNVLKAKQRQVEVVRASDIKSSDHQNLPIRRLYLPPHGRRLQIVDGNPQAAAEKLVQILAEKGLL